MNTIGKLDVSLCYLWFFPNSHGQSNKIDQRGSIQKMKPEEKARQKIDDLLQAASFRGWRFVDRKAVGVIAH